MLTFGPGERPMLPREPRLALEAPALRGFFFMATEKVPDSPHAEQKR